MSHRPIPLDPLRIPPGCQPNPPPVPTRAARGKTKTLAHEWKCQHARQNAQHGCMDAWMPSMHTQTHGHPAYTHARMHSMHAWTHGHPAWTHARMHAWMHARMHARMHAQTHAQC